MKTFSIGRAVSYGWKKVMENAQVLALFTLATSGVNWLIQHVMNSYKGDSFATGVCGIVSFLFALFVIASTTRMGLIEGRGVKATWKDLIVTDVAMYGKIFLTLVLTVALMAVVGLAAFLVSLVVGYAVAIPLGIIAGMFLSVKVRFAFFALLDGAGPIDSIKASFKMTEGCFWRVLGLVLLLALINIAGAVVLLIGLLVTIPLSLVAMGKAYHDLKA